MLASNRVDVTIGCVTVMLACACRARVAGWPARVRLTCGLQNKCPINSYLWVRLNMSTLEQVIKIVAETLDGKPEEFNASTNLQEAGFESLDVIEMIFKLEDEFKIDIPFNANEADTTQMQTVGDIAQLVETIKAKSAVR